MCAQCVCVCLIEGEEEEEEHGELKGIVHIVIPAAECLLESLELSTLRARPSVRIGIGR